MIEISFIPDWEFNEEDFPEPDKRVSYSTHIGIDDADSGVYMISNNLCDKFYVGSSKELRKRAKAHWAALIKGNHSSRHFQNFFNKHTNIHFRFSIIEFCLPEDRKKREQHYLDTLQPFGDRGFNMARKVDGVGCIETFQSEEFRQKLSEIKTIGFCQYSPEGKLISIHSSARKLAKELGVPETTLNKACNGRLQSLKGFIWRYDNGNMTNQLSENELSSIVWKPQKKIRGYTEQGELIADFVNAKQYSEQTGWDRKHIKDVCRRKHNFYKNLYWYEE